MPPSIPATGQHRAVRLPIQDPRDAAGPASRALDQRSRLGALAWVGAALVVASLLAYLAWDLWL